jgi:hypothetical protein
VGPDHTELAGKIGHPACHISAGTGAAAHYNRRVQGIDAHRFNRVLFALWSLFWLLMIVVAYQDHYFETDIRWWEPLLWEGSSALVATLWLVFERRAASRWDAYLDQPLRWFGKHLPWIPVFAITFVAAIYGIRHAVYAVVGEIYEHEPWLFTVFYESVKLILFAALWLCIIFGLESFVRWREERGRLLELQKSLAQAQLAQLRAQIQPHFLFNALNTISALMQTDVDRADRLLTRLADLLRASLAAGSQQMTSLRAELETLRLYASIMQERFAGRAELHWQVADEVLDAAIPAMLLQPLLENAYKHGVERSSQPVRVEVEARRVADSVRIEIRNSGSLNTTARPGIGLQNCRERLALIHGDRATLELSADAPYVTARITLPFERHAP